MFRNNAKTAWLLLAPLLAGILVFFVIPFIIMIRYSFTFGGAFVGFGNYRDILSSKAFLLAFGNTAKFSLLGVILNMTLSFLLALCLRNKFAGSRLSQSVILFPMLLPVAVIVAVVTTLFGNGGLVNRLLDSLGVPIVDWLDSGAAFYLMLGLYLFKSFGYSVILLLAGMRSIPVPYYEIARIEGASRPRMVFRITLPLLAPSLFFTFLIALMNCYRSFRDVFVLGGNHPHDSIYMLPHFFNNSIQNLNYPRLAVASVITLAATSLIIIVAYKCELALEKDL